MTQSNRDHFAVGSPSDAANPLDKAADYARTHNADEMANDARDTVQKVAEDVQEKAEQVGVQATEGINSAMSTAGQQLNSLAQTVRERSPEGQIHDLAANTAGALERSGDYLEKATVDSVRGDLESFIRQHPVESVMVGLGVGFLVARSMRR